MNDLPFTQLCSLFGFITLHNINNPCITQDKYRIGYIRKIVAESTVCVHGMGEETMRLAHT